VTGDEVYGQYSRLRAKCEELLNDARYEDGAVVRGDDVVVA